MGAGREWPTVFDGGLLILVGVIRQVKTWADWTWNGPVHGPGEVHEGTVGVHQPGRLTDTRGGMANAHVAGVNHLNFRVIAITV